MEILAMRVLIYGKSELIAQALMQVLQGHPDVDARIRLGELDDLCSGTDSEGDWQGPQVIVLDLSSLDHSFSQISSHLRRLGMDAPLVVLDVYHQSPFSKAFMAQGAAAYLPVESSTDRLYQAIEAVSQGIPYFPVSV